MEKSIEKQTKLGRMKELRVGRGGIGVLVGLDLPLANWGTEAGVRSRNQDNCLSQKRNI